MHSNSQIAFYILLLFAFGLDLCIGSLFYPDSSAYGIFAAIAVPLELSPRNVFVSYNFEANYNMPAIWGIPPIYQGDNANEHFEAGRKIVCDTNCSLDEKVSLDRKEMIPKRRSRSLITRTNVYQIINDKLKRSGFHGESCLLRLICETSATEIGEINGVLGSLIHVIFSPSTSEAEELPLRYYQAEHDGWHDQCHHYEAACKENFLDLISQPFGEIVNLIESNDIL
ncbi:uncharacterized protein LOC115634736 [Scaptodrosophila lebanonensis]|uniref:Uncharacterized protein LOC115634736 n=1 Tax=Drosophila lebanonensis TaxID=7225 RepID=A0A6J2UJT1_DROLE|nr:uncharacterized protein LOC115634736 [Scaptodrosophila lebanonensis]